MDFIHWLKAGNPSISHLVDVLYFHRPVDENAALSGWLYEYLAQFNPSTKQWGGGLYNPKWKSTFYVVRELVELHLSPHHPFLRQGVKTLVEGMWKTADQKEDDLCVISMLAKVCLYTSQFLEEVHEMMAYVISHQLNDSGFNCSSVYRKVNTSSISTTLAVLEALEVYIPHVEIKKQNTLKTIQHQAEAYLLSKKLLYRQRDGKLILSYLQQFHYPTRWRYDILKALGYFARHKYKRIEALEPALHLVENALKQGPLRPASLILGNQPVVIEKEDRSRMVTLYALLINRHFSGKQDDTTISLKSGKRIQQ